MADRRVAFVHGIAGLPQQGEVMPKRRTVTKGAPVSKPTTSPAFGPRSTLVAVVIIVSLGLIFFNQIVIKGEILTGGDVLAGAAIFEDYANEQMAAGHLPLWNPYIFCGMPFFESMTWSAFVYPSYWIKSVLEMIPGVELPRLFFLFAHYLLAGLGMFFYLRSRTVGHGGAVVGAAAFMLTPHLVGLATIGHGGKVLASAYIPLILMSAERLLDSGRRRWLAALALLGGLQFLARHVQVSYYTWLAAGVLLIHHVATRRRDGQSWGTLGARTGMLVSAGVLAAGLAAMLLLPLHEYSAYSTRVAEAGGMGFGQATMWSVHPKELLTFLVPSLFGLADRTYWGPMPFQQISQYAGYVVLCLAAIGAVTERSRKTRFLVALLVLGVVLSFGKYIGPVFRLLYFALPGFSRFRVPALFLLLVQFALAALAGHGASRLLGETGKRGRSWLPWALAAAAVGAVVGLAVMGARGSLLHGALQALMAKHPGVQAGVLREAASQAMRLASRDAGILLAFAAATAVGIFVVGTRRLATWISALLLLGLVVWDVATVDLRFLRPETMLPLGSYYPETPAVRFLKTVPRPFRVAPLGREAASNAWMYHRIESVSGYHPAKLAVMDDLLDQVGIGNLKLLAMLNVKYVVGPPTLDHPAFAEVAPGVHEFMGALPRAFAVGEVKELDDPSRALAEYDAVSFDPARYATVLGSLPGPVESADGAVIEVVSCRPNEVEVIAQVERPCLLVFSEVYYPPGWKAFVDGIETEIYRTNYAFRSVYLEPGRHRVVLAHVATKLRAGLVLSLLTGVAIVALWVPWERALDRRTQR